MKRASAFLLLTFLAFGAMSAPTQEASELFSAGSAAYESGDYLLALSHFENAVDAGMQGPAVHYNIASCHYRLAQFEQAEEAFMLVASRFPEMRTLAEYNLGLTLLEQEREAEAVRFFTRVRDDRSEPQLRVLAMRALERIDPAENTATSSTAWMRLVDLNIGHDDNVALIDDASIPANQSVDSPFTELVVAVSGPLKASPGFRFDGTVYSVRYDDAGSYDQNVARAGGVYHWQAKSWYLEAGPQLTLSTLDGDSFEQRLGGRAALRRRVGASSTLGIHALIERVEAGQAQFEFLDGQRRQVGFFWDRYGLHGRLTLGYLIEFNERNDPSVSPTRNRLSIRHRYTGPRWETDVQLAYRASGYDDLVVTRDEDRTELSLGVARNLVRDWQVNASYNLFDNDSTVDFYTYTRTRLTFGLTKNF